MRFVRRRQVIVWFIIITVFYLVLTKIDLIVHYDLYRYGLQFDETWAVPYWQCLTIAFWSIVALSVSSYWLESRSKNIFLVILIIVTVIVPYTFGIEDVLWFIWLGEFPPESMEWTWYWLNEYFPPWTTKKHIIYSTTGMIILVTCWLLFLAKKWIQFSFGYLKRYSPKKKKRFL